MKNLQDRIERLIDSVRDSKDVEALEIVQKQLENLRAQQLTVQKENRRITAENIELASKNKVLTQQIARMKIEGTRVPAEPENPAEFIEHLGVLFSRKPSGRILRAVYCPKCRRSMKSVSDMLPLTCSNCKTRSPFTAAEINDVVIKLERS